MQPQYLMQNQLSTHDMNHAHANTVQMFDVEMSVPALAHNIERLIQQLSYSGVFSLDQALIAIFRISRFSSRSQQFTRFFDSFVALDDFLTNIE